jgi:predicted 3-demethylubiquinone-9 3-methyltransferase (glyoxalase superfamily)
MRKIMPFLWFDDNAEEAANFYVSIFPRSRVVDVVPYGKAGAQASGMPKGSVMTVAFELQGRAFVVNCETQKEIDTLWKELSEGGDEPARQCGWLKDKFGVSWQIVPAARATWSNDPDPTRSERVMQALLPRKKIDIESAAGRAVSRPLHGMVFMMPG